MKYITWTLAVLILLGGFGYLVLSHKNAPASGEPIKVGVSTILTGDYAALGENIVQTAKLAVAQVNAEGGIDGRPLELVVEDAGLDSKTGLAAAQKLINVEGVKYIIGGTSSNGTLAAAPLANENKVIYMTPVTGGTNVDNAGEYIFRVANGDTLAGKDLADAALKLGFKNVATVTEVTEYTLDLKKSFESEIGKGGGTVVVSEEFQPGTDDFRTIVAKVKAKNPDAILIVSQTGIGGAYFVKQAREAGIAAPFMSDFNFVLNTSAKDIVGSFEGIYFADPAYDADATTTKVFFAKYQETYGTPPFIAFHAASTYDSVMLIAGALKAVGETL